MKDSTIFLADDSFKTASSWAIRSKASSNTFIHSGRSSNGKIASERSLMNGSPNSYREIPHE
jgi:hypothetical protein